MDNPNSHLPEGYNTVTPYLIIKGTAKAIAYYTDVFGATEEMRLEMPGGVIGHAEIRIGNSKLMLADECPQMQALSPETVGGTPVGICLYVPDADAVFDRAVAAGAQVQRPVTDQFYGDRSGTFLDPFGHQWTVATRKENLTIEEIQQRAAAMMSSGGDPSGK